MTAPIASVRVSLLYWTWFLTQPLMLTALEPCDISKQVALPKQLH